MALDETVEAFEIVLGQAKGQSGHSSSSVLSEFLPYLFSLSSKDAHHLRLSVSDFHSQTWQSDFSVSELVDLRDDIGIGGSLHDFLAYVRSALSSSSVKFVIGGRADTVGSATTAKVVAQKAPGAPLVSLPLRKLEGSAADDAKRSIAFGNFQAAMAVTSALTSEKAEVSGLRGVLAVERAKIEKLEEQINASSSAFTGRSRLNRGLSSLAASVSKQSSLPSTQPDTQLGLPSLPVVVSGTSKDGKEAAAPKAPGNNSRVPVAPISRRVKRRGTIIRDRPDE